MSFTKTAHLPVTPDEAYALITEPERLRRWQVVSAVVDLRAGGTYRWTVNPGHVAAGTYREVEPGKRIVFGFGWEGSDELPPDASTITVTIEPADGGSLVTLVHDGLVGEQATAHATGWNHYFERLEKLASTGTIEPDSYSWVPDDIDPLSAADAALAAIQPILRNLTPADQPKPTPCADFTCHELAEHLMIALSKVGGMAGGGDVVNPETGSLENRVSVMAAEAIDAWRTRGLDGDVAGPGGMELPAIYAAGILPIELLLHGWDFAQSSGQELRASDEVVNYVRGLAEHVIPGGRGRNFGDELQASPDAGALEQLAAYSGRRPMAV